MDTKRFIGDIVRAEWNRSQSLEACEHTFTQLCPDGNVDSVKTLLKWRRNAPQFQGAIVEKVDDEHPAPDAIRIAVVALTRDGGSELQCVRLFRTLTDASLGNCLGSVQYLRRRFG